VIKSSLLCFVENMREYQTRRADSYMVNNELSIVKIIGSVMAK